MLKQTQIISTSKKKIIEMDDGASIAVWDTESKGEPIVLVHGFPENHLSWLNLIQEFSNPASYRWIIYDLRGHGESSKIGEASLDRFFRDHLAVVKHLRIKKYHLIGHDWGGGVALHAARFTPQSLASLVILDTNYGNLDWLGMWHMLLLNVPLLPELLFRFLPEVFYEFSMKAAYVDPRRISKEADQSYRSMFRDSQTTAYWIRLYRNLVKLVLTSKIPLLSLFKRPPSNPFPASPQAWKVPTMLIWGQEDTFNPLWVGREIFHRLQKKTNVKFHAIPKAGHFVHVEQPKMVARLIRNHLKNSLRRRSR